MQYRRLGTSGLKVSEICLGTMTFGHTTDEAEAKRIVDLALDRGVNFFDTANTYSGGRSEELLGAALSGKRRGAVIATKFFNPVGDNPNDSGGSRYYIMNAVEESLRRLDTDHIDIYYIHHLDIETPIEETLRALDDLVRDGKVRYIACSNYPAWRLADGWWTSVHHDLERFICYQAEYSLVVRDIEEELVPLCIDKGIGIVPWGPLAFGFLTGKYKPGERRVEGTRSAEGWVWPEGHFAANADESLSALLSVSAELDCSPAQAALRWIADRPGVTSALVGARTAAQFEDNLGAVALELPAEAEERLETISKLPERYPWSTEKTMPERRASAVRSPDGSSRKR